MLGDDLAATLLPDASWVCFQPWGASRTSCHDAKGRVAVFLPRRASGEDGASPSLGFGAALFRTVCPRHAGRNLERNAGSARRRWRLLGPSLRLSRRAVTATATTWSAAVLRRVLSRPTASQPPSAQTARVSRTSCRSRVIRFERECRGVAGLSSPPERKLVPLRGAGVPMAAPRPVGQADEAGMSSHCPIQNSLQSATHPLSTVLSLIGCLLNPAIQMVLLENVYEGLRKGVTPLSCLCEKQVSSQPEIAFILWSWAIVFAIPTACFVIINNNNNDGLISLRFEPTNI